MQRMLSLLIPLLWTLSLPSGAETVSQLLTKEEQIRDQMITISRELGVTCTECHKVTNFKDDSKKTFRVSQDHMKLTQMLKEHGFDGKKGPEATCYMCHRGQLRPDYKEPASSKTH